MKKPAKSSRVLSRRGVDSPIVDETRCTGCGICVEVCPTACLAMGPHLPWLARPADCVSCGVCAEVCPANALRLEPVQM
jgi:NAD-dependent dihydropyrimidine dehydrogenase PreA subunit